MKSRLKQLCNYGHVDTYGIFNPPMRSDFDSNINETIHYVNYSPFSRLKPEIEIKRSFSYANTTSNLDFNTQNLASNTKQNPKLEILKNLRRKKDLFQKIHLNHIFFSESKIAIGDYGFINYLNQDF